MTASGCAGWSLLATPNRRVNRTAGKQRLPVRFGLRPTPAGYAERCASAP